MDAMDDMQGSEGGAAPQGRQRKAGKSTAKRHAAKQVKVKEPMQDSTDTMMTFGLVLLALLILFNQYQLSQVSNALRVGGSSFSQFRSLSFSAGGKIVGPQLNTDGKTTKLVEWPTISGMPKPKNTGDTVKDAIGYVIPQGVPFYTESGPGSELLQGLSFDDPITAQRIWAQLGKKIQLTPEEEQRYQKLTNVFTCDYCCGGPNSVTRIAFCGCQHAYAWKGMARFFVKYYPEKTDEEILGEMTKAKAMWYPKGMVEDYLVYTGQKDARTLRHGGSVGIQQQFAGKGNTDASASVSDLDDLNGMVGGC